MLATLLLVALASPSPGATVTLESVDGVTDGASYVSPFQLLIDGQTYIAMCYDHSDSAYLDETWQAVLYTFDNLSSAYFSDQSDYLTKYKKAAWLYNQLEQTTNPADMIGIQHAVWSLFVASAPSSGAAAWLAAASAAAQNGFDGLDFSSFLVVDSPTGTDRVQGFLVANTGTASTPEPITFLLLGAGLLLFGGLARRVRYNEKE
jgi:hypothetical protein